MTEEPSKSAGISPRRALLEEVLAERSKAVMALPVDEQDPPPDSPLWPLGALRLAARAHRSRGAVVDLAVLALAWLEAIDAARDREAPREG